MIRPLRNVIVFGASGLVGKKLIHQLNELDLCDRITVVVRRELIEFTQLEKVEQWIYEDLDVLLHETENFKNFSHAFSCLGTTLKKAGSKSQFYHVDYELNAHIAQLFENTKTHYLLISAIGADADSYFFYNIVKGKLEDYVKSLNLNKISFFRPSLLIGERQEQRGLEDFTQKLYCKLQHLIPSTFKYKPVTAGQVAHTMVEAALNQTEKIKIYDNLAIQTKK